MANLPFSFRSSGFNEKVAGKRIQEQEGVEDWGDIDSLCIEHIGFFQENCVQELLFVDPNIRALPVDQRMEEVTKNNDVRSTGKFLKQPRELTEQFLGDHSSQFKNFKVEDARNLNNKPEEGLIRKLSTEKIMRLAGERFIEFSSQKFININMLVHPYGSSLSHLDSEEKQDVEIVQLLLAAAEKVSCQQYDRASKLLDECELMASNTGTPSQRAVFYFAEALKKRIDREKRKSSPKGSEEENGEYDVACSLIRFNAAFLAWHQQIPFSQVLHFTAVQAILENVEKNTKVHVIDLCMRSGLQWAVFMQALVEDGSSPANHLKITAIETEDREKVEETGKSLLTFAKSLNLEFSFNIVFLSDMNELKLQQLGILPDEGVAVYASMALRTMISKPAHLETVMRVARNLDPSLMVVAEVEANLNSPSFINRFTDALFYYATLFDCLEDSMDRGDRHRMAIETAALREGIHNIVATEGRERRTRSVKLDVWRRFFAKFGMIEIQLSDFSLYQANLIPQQFSCGSSCTLEMDGKSLLVGWKGTPIHSLSAWKFH